jgi:hypothetical protein
VLPLVRIRYVQRFSGAVVLQTATVLLFINSKEKLEMQKLLKFTDELIEGNIVRVN